MKTSAMKILITTASFVLLAAVVLAAPATKGPEPMCPVSNQPCDP